MVRAKFKCSNKETNDNGVTIRLDPVIGGSPENDTFYKYTPWGEIRLGTVNHKAAEQFVLGAEYYVDFTRVSNEVS